MGDQKPPNPLTCDDMRTDLYTSQVLRSVNLNQKRKSEQNFILGVFKVRTMFPVSQYSLQTPQPVCVASNLLPKSLQGLGDDSVDNTFVSKHVDLGSDP